MTGLCWKDAGKARYAKLSERHARLSLAIAGVVYVTLVLWLMASVITTLRSLFM